MDSSLRWSDDEQQCVWITLEPAAVRQHHFVAGGRMTSERDVEAMVLLRRGKNPRPTERVDAGGHAATKKMVMIK